MDNMKKLTQVLMLVACFGIYSNASANYIFDIFDISSNDVGTLGFSTLTGNSLTGIFQAG
jgi:hypothetical protein